jgi:hypothetical protein
MANSIHPKGELAMDTTITSYESETDLKHMVTPGTIYAVMAQLREAAEETLALTATVTHEASLADLMATFEALQHDIHQLEEIAAAWQISVPTSASAPNSARPPPVS